MQRGLIFNERTGKTIKIGAATYNKLVLEGYTPDRAAGVLTPPTTSRQSFNGGARRASGVLTSSECPAPSAGISPDCCADSMDAALAFWLSQRCAPDLVRWCMICHDLVGSNCCVD